MSPLSCNIIEAVVFFITLVRSTYLHCLHTGKTQRLFIIALQCSLLHAGGAREVGTDKNNGINTIAFQS